MLSVFQNDSGSPKQFGFNLVHVAVQLSPARPECGWERFVIPLQLRHELERGLRTQRGMPAFCFLFGW